MTIKFLISNYKFSRPKHQKELFNLAQNNQPCDLKNVTNIFTNFDKPVCLHTISNLNEISTQLNFLNDFCVKFSDQFDCSHVNPCLEIICPKTFPVCHSTGRFIDPIFLCKNKMDNFLLPGTDLSPEIPNLGLKNFNLTIGKSTKINLNRESNTLSLNDENNNSKFDISVDNLILFFVLCLVVTFLIGSVYFVFKSKLQIYKLSRLNRIEKSSRNENLLRMEKLQEQLRNIDWDNCEGYFPNSISGLSSNASVLSKLGKGPFNSASLNNLSSSCGTPNNKKHLCKRSSSCKIRMLETLIQHDNSMSTIRNNNNNKNSSMNQTTILSENPSQENTSTARDDNSDEIMSSSTLRKPRSHTIHSSHAFDENFASIVRNMLS